MKSQENPTAAENIPNYMNYQKPGKSEPITQVQRDNVITSRDLPNRRVRYGLPLFILAIFLFVTAIYYGIINP
jgi:cytochrome oxidase assembly protein ShyY1